MPVPATVEELKAEIAELIVLERPSDQTCEYMLMLDKRLQVLVDKRRYRMLSREALRRKTSVGTVVREAIDEHFCRSGFSEAEREAAFERILNTVPIELPPPEEFSKELDRMRAREI